MLGSLSTSGTLSAAVLGCVVFLIGELGAEFFLTRLSLVIILAGLILPLVSRVCPTPCGFATRVANSASSTGAAGRQYASRFR